VWGRSEEGEEGELEEGGKGGGLQLFSEDSETWVEVLGPREATNSTTTGCKIAIKIRCQIFGDGGGREKEW